MEPLETLETSKSSVAGNTKQQSKRDVPSKYWVFTLNNWEEKEYNDLITFFNNGNFGNYIIGKEIGKENGTPHLQGYIEFHKKVRMSEIKNLNKRLHLEQRKGTREHNINYCSKEGNYIIKGLPRPLEILQKEQLYPWQVQIEKLIQKKPDGRSIFWFWESEGNVGKTAFTKYLCFHYGAISVSGKGADILYVTAENNRDIYIFTYSRSVEEYVSYDSMEKVKDGLYMSGKYESKCIIRNCPHIIVFSNFPPSYEKLSKDRWKDFEIKNKEKEIPGLNKYL
jgi:hypothetical protein